MVQGTFEGTVYETHGSGAPIVLIHGLGLNRRMWARYVGPLADNHTVLTYDLLGHGDSCKPTGAYRMAQFTDQLEGLVRHLGFERFALVGFSLGGVINRAYALAHPERLTSLVVLNSYHDRTPEQRAAVLQRVEQARDEGPTATVDAALQRWFTPEFAAAHPEDLAQVRTWVTANDPDVYPHLYHLMAVCDADYVESSRAIACPTLIVASADDPGNTPDMANRMSALIPGSRVEVIDGLRHMGLWEQPQAFLDLIEPFVSQHR